MSASRERIGGRLGAGVVAAFLAALIVGSGAALPGLAPQRAVAAAKKASSWKPLRTEKFSSSALPKGCGTYSGKYTGGSSAWSAKDVVISGGRLKLGLEKRTTSGQPYSSGGVGCWGWAQKYGRYEVRAKVPVGAGIDSYFTLVPSSAVANASTGVELLAPGPDTAYVTNGDGALSQHARVAGTFANAFHTYVIEWAPKHVLITVDGKEIYFSADSYAGSRWLGMVVSTGDALTGVPDAATALPAQFQIDQVMVSSYTGVPPPAPTAGPVPSGSALAGSASGAATPAPSGGAASPGAATPTGGPSAPVEAVESVSRDPAGRSLPGGVWPWLLGGSLLAAAGAAALNYARTRRPRRPD